MNPHRWPRWLIPVLCWVVAPLLAAAVAALIHAAR